MRQTFPHVKIAVRTVSFQDLARDSKKCLTVTGDKTGDELRQINDWAKQAGILPDTDLRFRALPAIATSDEQEAI